MAECYLGHSLRIQTKDGQFEGVVINIDPESTKITLDKVKVISNNGKRLRTPLHFYGKEIYDLKLIDAKSKKKKSKEKTTSKENSDNVSSTVTSKPDGDGKPPAKAQTERSEDMEEEEAASDFTNGWQDLSAKGYILLERIDKQFFKVMEHLKKQHFIGFSMGGVKIGRRGKVRIVQVYADGITYIFDIKSIGAELFIHSRGNLGQIAESHSIVKVMHDCRWISDFLHHRYGVQLNCVYDTQVADILVHRHEKPGDTVPRNTRSLADCLLEYLEISVSEVYSKMVHSKTQMDDEEQWEDRTLNHDLLDSAVQDVRYLLDLRVATLKRLMGELMCATHIYLTCVRDAAEGRGSKGKDPSIVPYGLNDLFRRGYRGMSEAYERFQFGDGQGDGHNSQDQSAPWDLWQPGQKLNPALHKISPGAQFDDAQSTMPSLVEATTLDESHDSTAPQPTTMKPNEEEIICNGKPAGAEDEASDSDEEDVFGNNNDDEAYSWFTRRKTTVEGEEPDVTPLSDVTNLHMHDASPRIVADSNNVTAHTESESRLKEPSYPKQNHKPPVIKSVMDLYNLPVNALPSSATDEESSIADPSESNVAQITNQNDQQTKVEPVVWPKSSGKSCDFVVKPAGTEKGTLFEALPSPQRPLDKTEPNPSLAKVQNIPSSSTHLHAEVERNKSPSIPELENCEEDDFDENEPEVTSHKHDKGEVHHEREFSPNFSSENNNRFSSVQSQRPDKKLYIPPRSRMRDVPPRFQKMREQSGDSSQACRPRRRPNHHVLSNDIVESGSETTSSSSSANSDKGPRRRIDGTLRYPEKQNASSKPSTYGELLARMSDGDSDEENLSDNIGRDVAGGSNQQSSSEHSGTMSDYDQLIAARTSKASPVGRGRAMSLKVSYDQYPGRRAAQENTSGYSTTLLGSQVRMDFPSEYELHHAPRAVAVPANSHMLNMKVLGRGRPY